MKRGFSQREKREHYNGIVKGKVPIKGDSIFSEIEQIAYAKGQADARNEGARIFAYKNATPAEREAYRQQRAVKRAAYLAKKNTQPVKVKKVNKSSRAKKVTSEFVSLSDLLDDLPY